MPYLPGEHRPNIYIKAVFGSKRILFPPEDVEKFLEEVSTVVKYLAMEHIGGKVEVSMQWEYADNLDNYDSNLLDENILDYLEKWVE